MKEISDRSIDLVVTSPPFNLGDTHHTGNKRHSAYPDNLPENEYQKQQIRVLNELFRIVKEDGSLFYHHKNRIKNGISITPYEWLIKTQWIIKQEIVWFNRSQNFDKIRFYPMTERIYWLSKNPNIKLINKVNKHDLWKFETEGTGKKHTRAYPEELVETIIKCFPNTNIILDPFIGSGTTAVVCKKLNRKFIGIEINSEYCKIAEERLKKVPKRLDSFKMFDNKRT